MDQSIGNINLRALYDAEKNNREQLQEELEKTRLLLVTLLEQMYHERAITLPVPMPDKVYQIAQLIYNIYPYQINPKEGLNHQETSPTEAEQLALLQKNNDLQQKLSEALVKIAQLQNQLSKNEKPEPPIETVTIETLGESKGTIPNESSIERLIIGKRILTRQELIKALRETQNISDIEAENAVAASMDKGEISLLSTSTKPPYGIEYPEIIISRQCEAKRILEALKDFPPNELPLLVYAGKDFLPKNGYSFVEIASRIEMEQARGEFTPSLKMINPEGQIIYMMYEGTNYGSGKILDLYLPNFRAVANDNLYFIALNPKIAKAISAEMNYRNIETLALNQEEPNINRSYAQAYITNIADWGIYEQKVKGSGNPNLPDTIWFTALSKGREINNAKTGSF